MKDESNPAYSFLASHGICALQPLYPKSQIEGWNRIVDPVIQSQDLSRRYVNAQKLYELGLLTEIFSSRMRSLIAQLIPNPVLHHCHMYEIDGNQSESHIRTEDGLLGWHRDDECLPDFVLGRPNCISIFVYMTDVETSNGPFELSNIPPSKGFRMIAGKPCYQMIGSTGYTFIFNRSYIHRAHPNKSAKPRRLLKLSVQPTEIANPRIRLPEFVNVLQELGDEDIYLKHLFGGTCDPDELGKCTASYLSLAAPGVLELRESAKIEISGHKEIVARAKNKLMAVRYDLSRRIRSNKMKGNNS